MALYVVLCMAVLAVSAAAQGLPTGADQWADALGEARSVQKLLGYAVVVLALGLVGVCGLVVKLLAGALKENTQEMRMCRERRERGA